MEMCRSPEIKPSAAKILQKIYKPISRVASVITLTPSERSPSIFKVRNMRAVWIRRAFVWDLPPVHVRACACICVGMHMRGTEANLIKTAKITPPLRFPPLGWSLTYPPVSASPALRFPQNSPPSLLPLLLLLLSPGWQIPEHLTSTGLRSTQSAPNTDTVSHQFSSYLAQDMKD